MSKIKYTNEILSKAIELRLEGKTIPEITFITGMKKPSLQKLFQRNNIKLDNEQKEKALAKRWDGHEPIVNGHKICSKCKENKPIEDFHTNKNRVSGFTSSCKSCYKAFYQENAATIKDRAKNYRLSNPEKKRLSDQRYYENHKDEYVKNATRWAKENPERKKEIERKYDKANQPKKNARTALRRATKLQATPKWLSEHQLDEIKRMYLNCPKGFHVDHIVPLNGENVNGLHVPWNLQYLPALENLRKSNKL